MPTAAKERKLEALAKKQESLAKKETREAKKAERLAKVSCRQNVTISFKSSQESTVAIF